MSAGGGQGNWGPWPVQSPNRGAVQPGEVKIDAGDANPGYLGAKVTVPANGGIIVGTAAGPPEVLTLKLVAADRLNFTYMYGFSAVIPPEGYLYTSTNDLISASPGDGVGEIPMPLDFVAQKVFLAVEVIDNTLVAAAGPPPVVNWSLMPYRNGAPIAGTALTFTNGQLGYHTNEATVVGAAGDRIGLVFTSLGLDPAMAQTIVFNATLYILGNGST